MGDMKLLEILGRFRRRQGIGGAMQQGDKGERGGGGGVKLENLEDCGGCCNLKILNCNLSPRSVYQSI